MYPPLSTEEIRSRRRQLRRERRFYTLKVFWQTLLLLGIGSSLLWAISQPDWTVRKPQQIRVQGNRALTETAVRDMLGLKYPVSLLHIEPQVLHQRLLDQGSILTATVHRELIPPQITVQVRDRLPVAVVVDSAKKTTGMLDDRGQWLPTTSYQLPVNQIPKLKLLANTSKVCAEWPNLYRAIQQSPVEIQEVDCRDVLNLMLKTEIGSLRLGSFDNTKIYKQLQEAHKLRNWQQYQDPATVMYLDLESPSTPKLQRRNAAASP
jgi:cell division protein FtsQ